MNFNPDEFSSLFFMCGQVTVGITERMFMLLQGHKKGMFFHKMFMLLGFWNMGRKSLSLPLKWFAIGQCWRYERMTRGRRREHYQWNMDIIGISGVEVKKEKIKPSLLMHTPGEIDLLPLSKSKGLTVVVGHEPCACFFLSMVGRNPDVERLLGFSFF